MYQGSLSLVEVAGLRSGFTYRFRVQAHNEVLFCMQQCCTVLA